MSGNKNYEIDDKTKDAGIVFSIFFTIGFLFYFIAKNIKTTTSRSASMGIRG